MGQFILTQQSVEVIIRDSHGLVVAAYSKYLSGQFTAFEVEMLAVECGILAQEMELSQVIIELDALSIVIIESDALSIVQSIADGETNGSLGHLYTSISQILEFFSKWEIKHLK